MTNEEAMDILDDLLMRTMIGDIENVEGYDMELALRMGIEALEKQISKNPLPAKPPMSGINVKCPNCEKEFSAVEVVSNVHYCKECGQRVDLNGCDEWVKKNE